MLLLVLCYSTKSLAQSVFLDYKEELLNEILLDLNDRYDVQISINAKLSNACAITINKEFQTMDLAMQALADKCALELVRIGEVYVFRALSKEQEELVVVQKPAYLYQGIVRESESGEALPFALVGTPSGSLVTDENGRFSFKSATDHETLLFRSLGYQDIDTTLVPGNGLTINLVPRAMELEDVVVLGERSDLAITNIGDGTGHVQLNNVNNNLIPGLSNNLIFNNLRLYPGIMASGESIADFVIWGSYAGQNHVIYDGISLFNSWGINDDMGRVNPFMIKHVEVYKGGYNVPYGDRVGGVVLIDGKSGNPNLLEVGASLTNQLISGYVNLPMFNNSASLQIAGRTTLSDDLDLAAEFDDNINVIVPKYDYSGLHVKFATALGKNDQLELSTIVSTDSYKGRFRTRISQILFQDIRIDSEQRGGSLKYLRNWANGGFSSFVLSRSKYTPELTTNYFINRNVANPMVIVRSELWNNPILETRGGLTHTFSAQRNHHFQVKLEFVHNEASFESDGADVITDGVKSQLDRVSLYGHDKIQVTEKFSMQLGLKADLPESNDKVYWQPRVNGQIDLTKTWRLNFGWGLYNQFISRNAVRDTLGNLTDVWQVANGTTIPVLNSTHHVLGVGYEKGDFQLSIEGYYKLSDGFTRHFLRNEETILAQGNARSRGLDMYVKKRFRNHEFWMSYSLAKSDERFSYRFLSTQYRLAPQSQRHELKAAAIFNFKPFRFSVTNVYGSGFSNSTFRNDRVEFTPYWRTDIAFQYRFLLANQYVETGFSVLNLLNRENVRLNQSINIPDGNRINTVGIPFTPTIYFNMNF